jgi:hypothetical protein
MNVTITLISSEFRLLYDSETQQYTEKSDGILVRTMSTTAYAFA